MINRIITRGMGTSRGLPGRAGMVTQGYGGVPEFIPEAIESAIRVGRRGGSRYLEELNEITVWARLLEINGKYVKRDIEGFVKVDKSQTTTKVISEGLFSRRIRSANEKIKIFIKKLK